MRKHRIPIRKLYRTRAMLVQSENTDAESFWELVDDDADNYLVNIRSNIVRSLPPLHLRRTFKLRHRYVLMRMAITELIKEREQGQLQHLATEKED